MKKNNGKRNKLSLLWQESYYLTWQDDEYDDDDDYDVMFY